MIIFIILAIIIAFLALCIFEHTRGLNSALKIIIAVTCIVLFSRPLICGLSYPWFNTLANGLLASVYTLGLITDVIKKQRIAFKLTYLDFPFFLYITCVSFSLFYTVNLKESLDFLYIALGNILIYRLVIERFDRKPLIDLLFKVLLLALTFVVIYGLYQYFIGFKLTREFALTHPGIAPLDMPQFKSRLFSQQVYATFITAPIFAGYLLISIPLIVTLLLKKNFSLYLKIGALILLVACIFSLLSTYSKAGWGLFVLGAIILVLHLRVYQKRKKTVVYFLLFIMAIAAYSFAYKKNLSYFANFFASSKVRLEYNQATIAMIKARPISGFGAGTYATVYPGYKPAGAEETKMAHNSFLQVWAECGIIGFIAFTSIWLLFIFNGLKSLNQSAKKDKDKYAYLLPVYIAALLFALHNLIDFDFYVPGISQIIYAELAIFCALIGHITIIQLDAKTRATKLAFCLFLSLVFIVFMYNITLSPIAAFYQAKSLSCAAEDKISEAELNIKKALKFDYIDAYKHYQLAMIYFLRDQKDSKDTLNELKIATLLDPYTPFLHYNLGIAYHNLGNTRLALYEFETASKLYPVKPKYHYVLSDMYKKTGNADKSSYHLHEAERLDKIENKN